MNRFFIKTSIVILFTMISGSIWGQTDSLVKTKDSLSLQQAIKIVLNNYPSVKQAESAIDIADARIGLAKTGYYPDIDFTGSYTRIGPVPTIDFPGLGAFQLATKDNLNASINVRQTIWDFGKTAKDVNYETQNKEIAKQSVEQLKQNLTYSVIRVYYSMVYLQEAIQIKEDQIKNLKQHLDFVQKKKNTGSATEYEILSTQVKLSNAESQKTDMETAKEVQSTKLNSLLGNNPSSHLTVKNDIKVVSPSETIDSMLIIAFTNRDEIKIANQKVTLADLRYQSIKSSTNPTLNFLASAGYKNGYVPDLNDLKANFVVGLGVKIPIFDANRKKFNLKQVTAFKQSSLYDIEVSKRNIANEVIEDNAQLNADRKKIKQNQIQVDLATKALSIAQVNFKEGAITNIDLLDATTNLSESKLLLLKSRIDFLVNIYTLKLSMGERL